MRVVASRYEGLSSEFRDEIEGIAEREFGHVPLVMETEWAVPDWTYLGYQGSSLVVFHNVIVRAVEIDGVITRAAGLNNMITLPAFRGRGFASELLTLTQPRWFTELDAEIGLLLCADALVSFYERLGWARVEVPVVIEQPGGPREWAANCMVLGVAERNMPRREVNLRGLPW
jgi:GNAT superfamily N-acetyltransferase